jgi:pimeloyl-ACP methyl ester carboxylesterase
MSKRRTALGLAAVAAGAVVGAAVEEVLSRRFIAKPTDERIGPPSGEQLRIESFDGTEIATTIAGREGAPTLVFAHGIIESSTIWHYQMADSVLADRYRLVAYDARGHGRSGPARGPNGKTPFTTQSQARDLVAVLEQATTDPVVLVGHSMGGMAIQALWDGDVADAVRDRVVGAVLVNTTYTAELAGWRGRGTPAERAFERAEDIVQRLIGSERVVARLRPGRSDLAMLCARFVYGRRPLPQHLAASVGMYSDTPSATIAAAPDLATADLYQTLPHIDVPILVITGTRDQMTPSWLSDEIVARVPTAELSILEGCGHTAPFERHDEVTSLIAKFAERVL